MVARVASNQPSRTELLLRLQSLGDEILRLKVLADDVREEADASSYKGDKVDARMKYGRIWKRISALAIEESNALAALDRFDRREAMKSGLPFISHYDNGPIPEARTAN